jgi:ankyrin repeat protein
LDVNERGGQQETTALIEAARHGHVNIVVLLCLYRAKLKIRATKHPDKPTALLMALQNRAFKVIFALLRFGADITVVDMDGYNALHWAVVRGKKSLCVIQALIKLGANVNARTNDGSTPLMLASYYGDLRIVKELLRSPDVLINLAQEGEFTALHSASQKGHALIMQMLVQHGADCFLKNSDRETSIDVALRKHLIFTKETCM